MPRFSWTITECRNAVPMSHGMSDAFSTGSHPQYPPQPSSEYDQAEPSRTPTVRNTQAISAKRRVARIHAESIRRVTRAPIANANGIENSA
jgi:hypothetical protein